MVPKLSPTLSAVILGGVIALGALSAGAAPARADGRDLARVLGGIVVLYAIGRAIEGHASAPVARQAPPVPAPRAQSHAPVHPPSFVAPARCFVEGRDRNGVYRGYGRRCMHSHVAHPRALPQACLITIHTQRGPREIYAGRCLAQNGWVREAGFRP